MGPLRLAFIAAFGVQFAVRPPGLAFVVVVSSPDLLRSGAPERCGCPPAWPASRNAAALSAPSQAGARNLKPPARQFVNQRSRRPPPEVQAKRAMIAWLVFPGPGSSAPNPAAPAGPEKPGRPPNTGRCSRRQGVGPRPASAEPAPGADSSPRSASSSSSLIVVQSRRGDTEMRMPLRGRRLLWCGPLPQCPASSWFAGGGWVAGRPVVIARALLGVLRCPQTGAQPATHRPGQTVKTGARGSKMNFGRPRLFPGVLCGAGPEASETPADAPPPRPPGQSSDKRPPPGAPSPPARRPPL